MTRLIKRYGSRKLYDTTESRYILLEDIADYVREGQEIQVMDNKTGEDVTSQTLTQVISEEGRKKANFLSSELLHDLIRAGENVVSSRVQQLQTGVEGFMKKSIDRLVPLRTVREEMTQLRGRLEELEATISRVEERREEASPMSEAPAPVIAEPESEEPKEAVRKTTRKRVTRKKPTGTTTRKSASAKKADVAEADEN